MRPPGGLRALAAAAVLLAHAAPAGAFDVRGVVGEALKHKDAIIKSGAALRKGFADLSPTEEYYIGRAVAARILAQYRTIDDPARVRYLNTLGQVLARSSALPETFGGWHFVLLDSDEVNAFAAPGGMIFVTRGLYQTARSEDQLAAVLAHEVGHVTLRHGLSAIKSSRLTEAFTIIGTEAVKSYSKADVARLTAAFEGTIDDIVNRMVVSGYSRSQEYDADAEAARIAWRAGYDPAGLTEFLAALRDAGGRGDKKGFFSTHPAAADRLGKAKETLEEEKLAGEPSPARAARFARHAL
jgi:predicted Zn-dependent protease